CASSHGCCAKILHRSDPLPAPRWSDSDGRTLGYAMVEIRLPAPSSRANGSASYHLGVSWERPALRRQHRFAMDRFLSRSGRIRARVPGTFGGAGASLPAISLSGLWRRLASEPDARLRARRMGGL